MGVALLAIAGLVLGSALLGALERRGSRGRELGPARPATFAAEVSTRSPDPWLYDAAPIVALLAVVWASLVLPLGPELVAADLRIGLFYFIVAIDFLPLALALGGWGANTKHSVEACYRSVAQLVAYVIPLGLAILGPIMMARSMSTVDIVRAQQEAGLWYALAQPFSFALYLVTALMQTFRPPFAEPFADRLRGGVLGTVGGARALLWRLALSGLLLVVSGMGAVLFLGGYAGPLLPGPLWMLLKTALVAALLIEGGRRLKPRSTAEMLSLSWKVLIPLGLLNVLVVGGLILLGVGQAPLTGGTP